MDLSRAPRLCGRRRAKCGTASAAGGCGADRGKTKEHKRRIAVDTMEDLLAVAVRAVSIHDTRPGILAARKAFEKYPFI